MHIIIKEVQKRSGRRSRFVLRSFSLTNVPAHAYQLRWKWNPLLKRFWEMCVNIVVAADE
jgi:hypothetical protein